MNTDRSDASRETHSRPKFPGAFPECERWGNIVSVLGGVGVMGGEEGRRGWGECGGGSKCV